MTIFTAQNAATLSKQIDAFTDQHASFAFNFGHDTDSTWFCHAEYGNRPKNGLTFAEVVEIANREADMQIAAELIAEEEAREEATNNSQFGLGA